MFALLEEADSDEGLELGVDDVFDVLDAAPQHSENRFSSPWAGFFERDKEDTAYLTVRVDGAELGGVMDTDEIAILGDSCLADLLEWLPRVAVGELDDEVFHLSFGGTQLSVPVEA